MELWNCFFKYLIYVPNNQGTDWRMHIRSNPTQVTQNVTCILTNGILARANIGDNVGGRFEQPYHTWFQQTKGILARANI